MTAMERLYALEREKLMLLADADEPAGEYRSPVFGCGHEDAKLLLIGEAPGAEETKLGEPFVGKAGKQLTSLLDQAGLSRADLYITNTVKYRPVVRKERSTCNRTPGNSEILAGLPLLKSEILTVRPKMIATLGNTPLSAMLLLANCGKGTVGFLHGKPMQIHIDGFSAVLFPLYHPASGIYNRQLIPVMEADARLLGEHLVKPA